MVTGYERIERMVPHRVTILIVVGASKIKTIESSLIIGRKMKRLLRETDDGRDQHQALGHSPSIAQFAKVPAEITLPFTR